MPQGSYADLVDAAAARKPASPATSSTAAAGCSAGTAASRISRSASARGSGIAAAEPLYVLRLDPETRRVVVGPRDALAETRVALGRAQLARRRRRPPAPRAGRRQAALGAAAGRRDAATGGEGGEAELVLDAPAGAVAPGQAAVLYDGDRVLGGGWIRRPQAPTARA